MRNVKLDYKALLYLLFLIFTFVFVKYHLFYTWDSSEYVGMASTLFTSRFTEFWFPVRGIGYPLLLKTFQILSINKILSFKIMTYIFYLIMLCFLIKIGKDLNIFESKKEKRIFILFIIFLIIMNPFIFLYYHMILTEFVSITSSLIGVYLIYHWTISNDKKRVIYYTIFTSLLTTYIYHIKPSLVAMFILTFCFAFIIATIKKFTLKNILLRLASILFCILMVITSIKIWNAVTDNYTLSEEPKEALQSFMISGQIMTGLSEYEEIYDISNLSKENGTLISKETSKNVDLNLRDSEIEEIKKVLDGKSVYKNFAIYTYKRDNSKQYVLFTKTNYTLKEQLLILIKIFVQNPKSVIDSYVADYANMTWDWRFAESENMRFAEYYYKDYPINISKHINKKYAQFMEDYKEPVHRGLFSTIERGLLKIYNAITSINFLLLPLLIVESIVFVLVNRKANSSIKNTATFSLISFTMSFACVMSYVIFGARMDRYTMPAYIPMYLGDVLLIITYLKAKNDSHKN